MNPTTAQTDYIGQIGGIPGAEITGLFMVGDAQALCTAPTNLTASDVTNHTAVLNWTETGVATAWDICPNDDEAHAVTVTEKPYTLTGLTPSTTYTVKVRANCSSGNTIEWSDAAVFTTDVACPTPADLTVASVGAVSVRLAWTAGDIYNLRYRTGDGAWTEILGDTLTSPYTLKNLQTGTTYEVGVGVHDETTVYLAPNPATSVCRILGLETEPTRVDLFDMRGKLLKSGLGTEFDVTTLSAGMYTVRVVTGDRVINLKLIRRP